VARRSYGSGSLEIRSDRNGRETWYGYWRAGGQRVKRRLGLKRSQSCSDGLTRVQAEQTLRRVMADTVVPLGSRVPWPRPARSTSSTSRSSWSKRTTIADYRGYLDGRVIGWMLTRHGGLVAASPLVR
jgi:hypothetical protein